jgi:hypothetical protein
MKDVPSVCSHPSPTKADVLARKKSRNARRFSLPETLLLLAVGGATGFFALQPPPPVLVLPAAQAEEHRADEPDDLRPNW